MPESIQHANLSNHEVLAYSQGVVTANTSFLAEQLAPTTPVGAPNGQFKKYDTSSAFLDELETARASGGDGLMIQFDGDDPSYNCKSHGVNTPIDVANLSDADVGPLMMQAADMVAFVKGLAHERAVFKKARALVSATSKNWADANDPVKDIDAALRAIILGTYGGFGMEFHIAFGMGAWETFKNNAKITGKFVVNSSPTAGVAFAVPNIQTIGSLFLVDSQTHLSMVVQNTAKKGLADSRAFLLDNEVMLWARAKNPNQMDQGFMKTFRLRNQYMAPRRWKSPSGVNEFAGFFWSQDIQEVNAQAAIRYTITK